MARFTIIIEKGSKNYSAASPDALGCVATGKTIEETLKNMKEALEFHLEEDQILPVAKSLEQHIADGILKAGEIVNQLFITEVEIALLKREV